MPLWNEIEGKTLDGLPLQTLLRTEGRTAWFTTTDNGGQPATVSVFEALNDEETEQARLETAAHVQHPNLLAIRGTGTALVDEEPLVYAVMEPFDQTLADVLRERPLTPDETRDVADSLLSALETVENAGMYHGHVDASGVLGVGDAIKLRSDCLMPRHGDSDAPALGALIYNALTGRRYSSERDALQLPAPFATLVRAGAGSNGSLAAMRRVLHGGSAVASAPSGVIASSVTPVAPPPAAAALANDSAPRTPARATAIPRAALDDVDERPRKWPMLRIAAVVIMAVLLVIFWYAHKRPAGHTPISGEAPSTNQSNPSTAAEPAMPPPAPAKPSAASPAAQSDTRPVAPKPAQRSAAAVPSAEAGGERSVWHVVVYTYNREEAAQHKATDLAARYPQLEPQVFSPSGHAPFLVALGAGMDRQDAFTRRDAARTAGLPPDTYAQNFRK